jgi:hypothetical protein
VPQRCHRRIPLYGFATLETVGDFRAIITVIDSATVVAARRWQFRCELV